MHHGGVHGQHAVDGIQVTSRVKPVSVDGMLSGGAEQSGALSGLRLAVTAADLEQLEHRGIAAYTRNLLKALAAGGAEVWLITEFDPKLLLPGFRQLPPATRDLLRAAKILDDLCAGHSAPEMSSYRMETTLPPGLQKLNRTSKRWQHRLWAWFSPYIPLQLIKRDYREQNMHVVLVHEHRDNPYLRHQRLDYLDGITGILCAPRFFGTANWLASRVAKRGVCLKLRSFDALITTCPINLMDDGRTPVLQSIHDLIPIEFARHGESPVAFTRRLQASLGQGRLFMSKTSQEKYQCYIGRGTRSETVIVQPPSLQRDLGVQAREDWSWLPEGQRYRRASDEPGPERLKTLRYILFNSSIEPRKNTIFLVKAFLESKLSERGYSLCITGSLKQDSYSDSLRKIVAGNPHICLTGYVDEPTKFELYSRALTLVSPSLVEGFGIPVLDAACMGVPTLASESGSHAEIQQLHDFDQFITLLRTIKTTSWAMLMQKLAVSHEWYNPSEAENLVAQRIERYSRMQGLIEHEFRSRLYEALLEVSGSSKNQNCHLAATSKAITPKPEKATSNAAC